MKSKCFVLWALACCFSLPSYAVPDTVGQAFVGGRISQGVQAFGLSGSASSDFMDVSSAPVMGLVSFGYGFSSDVNLSFFIGYAGELRHAFSAISDSSLMTSQEGAVLGVQWDAVIHQFENSRILAGASLLSQRVFLEGRFDDSRQNEIDFAIVSFTPSLSYEHFLGDHFSLGGSLTLPFSSVVMSLENSRQQIFAVTTYFEPLMFAKYYF